jgi:MFS family permease
VLIEKACTDLVALFGSVYSPVERSSVREPVSSLNPPLIAHYYMSGCSGALLAGFTANKIGRKRTIQLGSLIATVGTSRSYRRAFLGPELTSQNCFITTGCAIQTGAINVGMLIAGRFIAGLAIGSVLECSLEK